ncbi:AMP-binding protein, partial [Gilvimarinus sp. SDUM040013]|nr:AMP-binding protein [Gilvimarinus sp. SDUM040013]
MQQALQRLVGDLLDGGKTPVAELSILPDAERHQQLIEWNDTRVDYPHELCIHELFEQQVARSPEAIAVQFGEERLSYQQLNERSNQLAHYLVAERGVEPDTLVGLCVERSVEMVIGLLGIIKAGG